MKQYIYIFLFVSGITLQVQAQPATPVRHYRVGIFAPLYLDSVFSATGNFKYAQGMPKFIAPAVDFITGAQVALDHLYLDSNQKVTAYIYDTKSYKKSLAASIKSGALDSLDLLMGPVKDNDYKLLADFALLKNIPFVSASYPNDGGITNNPFVLVLNSTLRAHCEAIYSYILQNHGTDKIFLCRKKGQQEDKVAAFIKAMNEPDGKPLLNIQTINFDSSITASFLKTKLDSNRRSVIIGGSLDQDFAFGLSSACNMLDETYPITLMGMPNWDGLRTASKKTELEDFPIIVTTPYYNAKTDANSKLLMDEYMRRTKGKPSDMCFKGYETARYFVKLLMAYPNDMLSHINDKGNVVFTEFNFRPVFRKGVNMPDYLENKHLYFVRLINGNVYKAW
jgi:hypothetical protein